MLTFVEEVVGTGGGDCVARGAANGGELLSAAFYFVLHFLNFPF